AQEFREQSPEPLAHGDPWTVRLFHGRHHLFTMRETNQGLPQLFDRSAFDADAAYRALPSRGLGRSIDAHAHRLMILSEHPGVVDFGEVVILGREPKYRNRREP